MLVTMILLINVCLAAVVLLQLKDIKVLRRKLDRFRHSLFQLSNGEAIKIGAVTGINKRAIGQDTFVSYWQGNSCTMVGYKTGIEANAEIDRVISAVLNYGKFE